MYVIPPHSSTPRWMPDQRGGVQDGVSEGSTRHAKQRMISHKRKHSREGEDQITLAVSARQEDKKRSRIMHTVSFALSSPGMDVDDIGSLPSSSSADLGEMTGSSSSAKALQQALVEADNAFFPRECLRLTLQSPTGHPHPYTTNSDSPFSSSYAGSTPGAQHGQRNELGASYFDPARF